MQGSKDSRFNPSSLQPVMGFAVHNGLWKAFEGCSDKSNGMLRDALY